MTSLRKSDFYRTLTRQAEGLLSGERDRIANAANLSALLWMELEDINWVGFYFDRGDELVLGPFQGKPACVRIPMGEGVCGQAAAQRRTLRVDDVHAFEGHIACDVASNAEVVVPLVKNGTLIGVLDVDSPTRARFDDEDAAGFEAIAQAFVESVDA